MGLTQGERLLRLNEIAIRQMKVLTSTGETRKYGKYPAFQSRRTRLLKHMKTHKHLKPGENGTKLLVERFGDSLVCVRYRYDAIRDMRIKTAEIVVDEKPGKGVPRISEFDSVLVQVPFTMKALRDRLKSIGAKWDPVQKLWRVRWGLIRGDKELVERVVKG